MALQFEAVFADLSSKSLLKVYWLDVTEVIQQESSNQFWYSESKGHGSIAFCFIFSFARFQERHLSEKMKMNGGDFVDFSCSF